MTTEMTTRINVDSIPPLDHDSAMALAAVEVERLLDLVGELSDDEWEQPTECPGWTVRDVLAHLLGMWKLQYDPDERTRQLATATQRAQQSGRLRIDELTALQIADHAELTNAAVTQQLRAAAPLALAGRRNMPAAVRAATYDPLMPGEALWTLGYLFDTIHTRDPWMHRIDICRALGREMQLTVEHDARLIADAVSEWARRHGQPFTLHLTGPVGRTFTTGTEGGELSLDSIEFCRILSGRGSGPGLLSVRVPF